MEFDTLIVVWRTSFDSVAGEVNGKTGVFQVDEVRKEQLAELEDKGVIISASNI